MRAGRISFGAVGTELDVSSKIRHWCARAERSPQQVRRKLADWGASDQADRILHALLDEDYVNPVRFAEAFTHDHLEFRNWGPAKILSALTQAHWIDGDVARKALSARGGEAVEAAALRAAQGWRRLRPDAPREKAIAALARKGFSIDCAIRAAEAAEAD